MITKRQFDILTYLETTKSHISQRDISKKINSSLGSVNNDLQILTELSFVNDGVITKKGLDCLKPFKVERAIFIAAGFGSRMIPVTLNTPKPLVKVNDIRIIDTMLDAVLNIGIHDIYIVRGYLSEQFDELLHKYPMIKFIENPDFNESNNISSAMYAKDLFSNSYVFEGDLFLYNKNLITKYQYSSNYLGIPVKRTDDWCFKSKNSLITELKVGGTNCHEMVGISYWTKDDGFKLSKHIKKVYESPGGKEKFWDQIVFDYYLKDYDLSIRECTHKDIIEIDTLKELIQIDNSYSIYT